MLTGQLFNRFDFENDFSIADKAGHITMFQRFSLNRIASEQLANRKELPEVQVHFPDTPDRLIPENRSSIAKTLVVWK